MSGITTHVLDTARGLPAVGVGVRLERLDRGGGGWQPLGSGRTDAKGRLTLLAPGTPLDQGDYRLSFDTWAYFGAQQVAGFYTEVVVAFVVRDAAAHHHVPLLLSPYGYTTYRGS